MAKTKISKRSKTSAAAAVSKASAVLDALAGEAANEQQQATIKRHYSREFKISAVRLVKEQGYTVVAAAKSLGVDDHNVRDWVNALGDEVGGPVNGEAALRVELHRLRRENARLLMERDILKKAAAYFAREQQP
jgi:transposase